MGVLIAMSAMCAAFQVHADDWGCKVLLCLANPAGPEAVAECVPPIEALWSALRHVPPDPFPTCDMASGPNGKSYAKQGYSYYDPCPGGTTPLDSGALAIKSASGAPANAFWAASQNLYTGIGSGDGLSPSYGDYGYQPMPAKVCVGTQTGTTWTQVSDSEGNYTTQMVATYDQVTVLSPTDSPRIIDVYIDNQLYHRVRW